MFAPAKTFVAPRSFRATTAFASVPPVSTMSSMSKHVLPSTSPTTFATSAVLGPGRRLSMIASAAWSRLANPRAIFADPTSGATTTRFGQLLLSEIPGQDGRRIQVIHRDVEKGLDLMLMEIHPDHAVGTGSRHEICG